MAPEILAGEAYDLRCDIYSYGIPPPPSTHTHTLHTLHSLFLPPHTPSSHPPPPPPPPSILSIFSISFSFLSLLHHALFPSLTLPGIVLWEIATHDVPWRHLADTLRTMEDLRTHVLANKRPPLSMHVPDAYRALVVCCWDADPARRPPFSSVVLSKIFRAASTLP
jgi:hypothetical protein